MRLFVDTNVILDFLLKRDPYFDVAARLADRIEAGVFEAYVSAISFNNVYYLARKYVGNERAIEMLRQMRRLFRVIPLDEGVLDQAIALALPDFEDAIQAVSARRAATNLIVTRNARDFANAELDVYSPDEIMALLDPQLD